MQTIISNTVEICTRDIKIIIISLIQLVHMHIYISDETDKLRSLYKKDMESVVTALLQKLGLPDTSEISILFTDDKNMRAFNKSYRELDKTTDVLSFPQGVDENNHVLGDILISVDATLRQARTYRVDPEDEIDRLLVHGILHLLGYDHKKKKEREHMRKKENSLINHINNL